MKKLQNSAQDVTGQMMIKKQNYAMDNFIMKILKFNSWRILSLFFLLANSTKITSLETPPYECSPSVIQALKKIDPKEKDILKYFFQSLFASGDFAYTLFGNKPLALIDHNLEFAFFEQNQGKLRRKAILELKGWKVWKKHSYLFPINQFYFLENKNQFGFYGALISKKHCRNLINKHYELFKNISEPSSVIETIFDKMNNAEVNNKAFPEHYFQCLGILLGYGQKNAQAYEQEATNIDLLALAPFDLKKYSTPQAESFINQVVLNIQNVHLPSNIYSPQIKELINQLCTQREFYGSVKATHRPNPLCPIRTPGFMAINNDPETEDIINDYDSLRERLVQIYYSDLFIEIILTRLTSIE